jgi:hypothetical protein
VRDRLRVLARDAWQEHRRAQLNHLSHLVLPSIPILFFGDSLQLAKSPLRVITVGLNPSREEFPRGAPFSRFPGSPEHDIDDLDAYLAGLDGYFRADPYGWFDRSFEPLLRGLGASYYDGSRSCAVHTDLCSPLATDPTWTGLGQADKAALEPPGMRLWHRLAEALQPDVVLISIARRLADRITFPVAGPVAVIHVVDGPRRTRPYQIEAQRRRLASGKKPLFVFGRAAQHPFGLISTEDKERAGASILEASR